MFYFSSYFILIDYFNQLLILIKLKAQPPTGLLSLQTPPMTSRVPRSSGK